MNDPLPGAPAPEPRNGTVGRAHAPLRLVAATALDHPGSQPVERRFTGAAPRPQFDLGGQTINGLRVHDAILVRSSFVDAELHLVQITDTAICDSDLSAAVFDTADLHRVTFRRCQMVAALFTRSRLRAVRFEDCTLVGASFVPNTLDDVAFDGCDLADAELHPDHVLDCRFVRCDLTRLTLVGDPGAATISRHLEH